MKRKLVKGNNCQTDVVDPVEDSTISLNSPVNSEVCSFDSVFILMLIRSFYCFLPVHIFLSCKNYAKCENYSIMRTDFQVNSKLSQADSDSDVERESSPAQHPLVSKDVAMLKGALAPAPNQPALIAPSGSATVPCSRTSTKSVGRQAQLHRQKILLDELRLASSTCTVGIRRLRQLVNDERQFIASQKKELVVS